MRTNMYLNKLKVAASRFELRSQMFMEEINGKEFGFGGVIKCLDGVLPSVPHYLLISASHSLSRDLQIIVDLGN